MARLDIEVWACRCGNYYASSSVHGKNLNEMMNHKLNSSAPTHSRALCPNCKAERRKVTTTIAV